MIQVDLSPNSSDWELWRSAGLGSSDAPILIHGKHFERTFDDLLQEKRAAIHGGTIIRRPMNSAMKRGKTQEAKIRVMYEQELGVQAPPVCGVHDTIPWMKASLDGWVTPAGIILEIKRPGTRRDGSSDHDAVLEGHVPEKYLPQIWHQCLVANTTQVHYVSYGDKRYGDNRFYILPYSPRPEDLERLLALEKEFWTRVLA